MNLYGYKLYSPEGDSPEAAKEAEKLVLDIEGLEHATEEQPAEADDIKMPEVEELVKSLAEQSPADTAAEVAATMQRMLNETKESREPAEELPQEPEQAPEEPAEAAREQLASVSYESVAKAMETAQKEPTGRFNRDAIDDETLLSELYALIGGPSKPQSPAAESVKPAPVPQKPAARITPETLQALPEEPEELVEEDAVGNPGWLKGIFILLISLLLSAMTCYAVASDVIGKIF